MKSRHAAFGVFADSKSGAEQLIDDLRTEAGNCRRDSPAHPNYIAGLLLLAVDALTELRAELKNAIAAIGKRVADAEPAGDDEDEGEPAPAAEKHRHRFDPVTHQCACGSWKRGHQPAPAAGGAP
jgi:hypothetical protein